jgi:hypothetical protein
MGEDDGRGGIYHPIGFTYFRIWAMVCSLSPRREVPLPFAITKVLYLSNSIHLFCEYRQKLPLSSNHPLLVMAIRRASIHTQVQHMKETAKG